MPGFRSRRPRMMWPCTSASLIRRNMAVFPACLTSEQLTAESGAGRLLCLDLAAHAFRFLVPAPQIAIDFVAVTKIVSQDRMDIGQSDDVLVAFRNGFGR